mmetsp:Transcript_6036/g.13938  ORF Transcript_6036/g.13938 Transcript_6036/m.13938 type:complete len:244 (-) Transcript_6036:45-776(-)|eukprot:747097-Hanusia_phi.AAC.2
MQGSGEQENMAAAVAPNSVLDMSSTRDDDNLAVPDSKEGKFESSGRKPECEGIDAAKSGRSGSIVGLSEVGKVGLMEEEEDSGDANASSKDSEITKPPPASRSAQSSGPLRRANTLQADSHRAAAAVSPPECFRGICAVMGVCICNMKDRAKPTIAASKLCQNSFRGLAVEAQEAPQPEVEKPVRPDVIKEKEAEKGADAGEEGLEKEEEGTKKEGKGGEEANVETRSEDKINLVGSTVKGLF